MTGAAMTGEAMTGAAMTGAVALGERFEAPAHQQRRSTGLRTSPLTVRAHDTLDGEVVERYWAMYEEAFGPLRTLAASRQVLTREEFDEEMADARVTKHVAYDAADRPIAMLTLTSDLSAVPWLSPEYFAARHPEHAARNAIFYLGFVLVDPAHQRTAVMERLVDVAVLQPVSAVSGICAFDTCGFNRDRLRFARRFAGILARNTESWELNHVDAQHYYDIVWS